MNWSVKVILGLLIILTLSCKKKELEHFYVSDAFKRWTVFNQGSYWIFQNDTTLFIDSVFVVANPKYLEVEPNNTSEKFTLEHIEMQYSSTFFRSSRIDLNQGGKETFNISLSSGEFLPLIASSSDNFLPFGELTDNYTYQLISTDSVYFLGHQKFYDVISTLNTDGEKKSIFWFAKSIGLIKVSCENTGVNFSWSLIRYHVNQ